MAAGRDCAKVWDGLGRGLIWVAVVFGQAHGEGTHFEPGGQQNGPFQSFPPH